MLWDAARCAASAEGSALPVKITTEIGLPEAIHLADPALSAASHVGKKGTQCEKPSRAGWFFWKKI